ncbi:hypothetical protein HNR39_004560 [Glaciimonas immobilis]|uniref:Uncharacterized protein n=1 Tax=Glaciimonas immobilis TaxID=728004 RepID=A0A840S267_9BURK|nr:hypothetical protein [Glaciimonas immobilis]
MCKTYVSARQPQRHNTALMLIINPNNLTECNNTFTAHDTYKRSNTMENKPIDTEVEYEAALDRV